VTVNLDFRVTGIIIDALDRLCVQLTRDLFATAKFLFILICTFLFTNQNVDKLGDVSGLPMNIE